MESRRKKGYKIAEDYERKPKIYPDLLPVWDIFMMLNSSRQIGMAVNPLSMSEIKAALEMTAVPHGAWATHTRYIMKLDAEILKDTSDA